MSFLRIGLALAVGSVVTACAAGHYSAVESGHAAFVVPHHIAEGKGEGEDLPPPAPPELTHAASVEAPAAPPALGFQPDPTPLSMREQWQYELLYRDGTISVEHVRRHDEPKPVITARRIGRFALELWIGHELIDRVRFDFPLIAADDVPEGTRRPLHDSLRFGRDATARISVLLPASPRATRLQLVDRATGITEEFPWPPDGEPKAPAAPTTVNAPALPPSPTSPATVTNP